MNISKIAAVAVIAITTASYAQAADDPAKLNDLQIAHVAYTADNIDIRYAHLALAKSKNPEIHKFARTMIRDHNAVNDQALALLEENHTFPGPYVFRVVVRPDDVAGIVSAVTAGAGEQARFLRTEERPSRKGTYVALHVHMELPHAEAVLDVYEVVGQLDGVLATL